MTDEWPPVSFETEDGREGWVKHYLVKSSQHNRDLHYVEAVIFDEDAEIGEQFVVTSFKIDALPNNLASHIEQELRVGSEEVRKKIVSNMRVAPKRNERNEG